LQAAFLRDGSEAFSGSWSPVSAYVPTGVQR
jgi:hypothetical protein